MIVPVGVFGSVLGPDHATSILFVQRLLEGDVPACQRLLLDVATILRKHLGAAARRVQTRQLSDWLVRVAALFLPKMKLIVPELGRTKDATSDKAQRLLG